MGELPLTRNKASVERAASIRRAVQQFEPDSAHGQVVANKETALAFLKFLDDPAVSAPIYSLPKPITPTSVARFIDAHLAEKKYGEGLLLLNLDPAGRVSAYHDIQFWPEWSACELGGAIHPDLQGKGAGATGAKAAFNWLFETFGVELICETAALDNLRTARLLERLGFTEKAVITCTAPDGTTRPSRYWEITRAQWREQNSPQPPA